jgi:hypothetical protein
MEIAALILAQPVLPFSEHSQVSMYTCVLTLSFCTRETQESVLYGVFTITLRLYAIITTDRCPL